MTASAPQMPATSTAVSTAGGYSEPEYLRRRAPARVEVTDVFGRPLRMTWKFIHVRAGQQIRVRVVPQASAPDAPQSVATICPSEALYSVANPHQVPNGTVHAVHAQYQVRQRGRVPIPKRAALHITITEPGHEAFTLSVPLAVWPSWWLLISIGFVTVAGPLVGNRFVELTKTLDPFQAVTEIATNTQFLSTTTGFAVLAAGALKLLGWAAVWVGLIAGDSE